VCPPHRKRLASNNPSQVYIEPQQPLAVRPVTDRMACATAVLRATMRRRAAGCSSWMSRALWTSAHLRTMSVHRPTRASAPAAASASPAAPAMSPTPSSSATWCGNASPSMLRPQGFIMSVWICDAARPILQSPVWYRHSRSAPGVAHGQRAAVFFAVPPPPSLRHGTASCQMLPVQAFPSCMSSLQSRLYILSLPSRLNSKVISAAGAQPGRRAVPEQPHRRRLLLHLCQQHRHTGLLRPGV